jgi:hypothetical protein
MFLFLLRSEFNEFLGEGDKFFKEELEEEKDICEFNTIFKKFLF